MPLPRARPLRRAGLVALLALCSAAGEARAGDPPGAPWKPSPPERVTQGADPWLSPGGKRVAFLRHERDLRRRDLKGQPVGHGVLYLRDLATGSEARAETD